MRYVKISLAIRFGLASISLVASSTIATVILAKQRKGPVGPYCGILLGLSVADIIQSICIIAGRFAVERGSMNAFWAIGTKSSCNAQAFFIHASTIAMPMYMFTLQSIYTFYFVLNTECPEKNLKRYLSGSVMPLFWCGIWQPISILL